MADAPNDDNKTTQFNTASAADAGRAARAAKRKNASSIPNYRDENLAPEVKEKMEIMMKPIIDYVESLLSGETANLGDDPEKNMASSDLFSSFGKEPILRLGQASSELLDLQKSYNSQMNVMDGATAALITKLQEKGIDGLVDAIKAQGEDLIDKGVDVTTGALSYMKGILDSATSKKARKEAAKEKRQQLLVEMGKAIPEYHHQMLDLIDKVRDTEEGVAEVIAGAESLGYTRVSVSKELRIYIGAGEELRKRFNEIYIPEAKEIYDESGADEDRLLLSEISSKYSIFLERLTELEASHTHGNMSAVKLQEFIKTTEDSRRQCRSILQSGQAEMEAILAEANFALSGFRAAKTVEEWRKLVSNLEDNSMKITEATHKMSLNAQGRSTLDPEKIKQIGSRLETMMEETVQNELNKNKNLEATRATLREVSEKLIDKEKTTEVRLLDSISKEPRNDNQKTAPAPAKKPDGNKPGVLGQ